MPRSWESADFVKDLLVAVQGADGSDERNLIDVAVIGVHVVVPEGSVEVLLQLLGNDFLSLVNQLVFQEGGSGATGVDVGSLLAGDHGLNTGGQVRPADNFHGHVDVGVSLFECSDNLLIVRTGCIGVLSNDEMNRDLFISLGATGGEAHDQDDCQKKRDELFHFVFSFQNWGFYQTG